MAGIATSGITWEELYEGSGHGDGPTKTRVFLIAWTDLKAFLNALEGGYFALNNTNYYFNYPDEHPDFTGFFCQHTSYEGLGAHTTGTASQIAYSKAKVTAEYSPLKFDANGTINTIYIEELDFGAEVVSIPGGSMKDASNNHIQEPIQKIFTTVDYTLTINGAPELPGGGHGQAIQDACASPLNDATFLGAAAKKVMFKGGRATREVTNQGAKKWKIILHFSYRSVEWTKIYSKVLGDWSEVKTVPGDHLLYESSNLALLLPR
jgi:hypothetical protein